VTQASDLFSPRHEDSRSIRVKSLQGNDVSYVFQLQSSYTSHVSSISDNESENQIVEPVVVPDSGC
jgi:predicted DNA binding protein